jgi:hypothetical protein
MKKFEEPKLDVQKFGAEDVITASEDEIKLFDETCW